MILNESLSLFRNEISFSKYLSTKLFFKEIRTHAFYNSNTETDEFCSLKKYFIFVV
jgi:hypothetical protein